MRSNRILAALVAWVLAGVAQAADSKDALALAPKAQAQPVDPAVLRLLNLDIVTFRATLPSAPPERRVERARQRIRDLPDWAYDKPLRTIPFEFQGLQGVQFMLGEFELFPLIDADVDAESGQRFDALTWQTLERLEEARTARQESRHWPLLFWGLAKTLAGTLALSLLVWALSRATRKSMQWLGAVRDRMAARHRGVDWREFLARPATGTTQLVYWLLLLVAGYRWLGWVLGSFGATRLLAAALGYFFDAVQRGRLQVPFMHPETTSATRRIVTLVVWGLGIAVAYPYLPGSSSDAFKGLSVLFGVMVTLGSAGIVTQAMSGLVVVYSRALRRYRQGCAAGCRAFGAACRDTGFVQRARRADHVAALRRAARRCRRRAQVGLVQGAGAPGRASHGTRVSRGFGNHVGDRGA